MNMPIQFRLKELMAAKERKDGAKVTYRVIRDETGINLNTLAAMANNKMNMVGLNTIDKLTGYFNCEVGDLMIKEQQN